MASSKIFIIAEFGMLHEGSFGTACKMAEVARQCGADAVKFQTNKMYVEQ